MLLQQFQRFVNIQSAVNPTFAFWSSYLEMVQLLMLFIRATREGNWELHLSTVRSMLPWFFACDKSSLLQVPPCLLPGNEESP